MNQRRKIGDNFGDFFDFHVAQYSTAGRINHSPSDVHFGSKADIAHRPDGYTGSDESRLAVHGASSGGAAMIASKSDHICGEIGGGGLDYPGRRLARRPPSAIGLGPL